MREYRYKSTNGNGNEYVIRKAVENNKQWVFEVYFSGRKYPNIISGRYKTLKDTKDAMGLYQTNKTLATYGNAE